MLVSGTDLKDSNVSSRRGSAYNNTNNNTSGTVSRQSSGNVSLRSRSGSRKTSLSAKNGLTGNKGQHNFATPDVVLNSYLGIKRHRVDLGTFTYAHLMLC